MGRTRPKCMGWAEPGQTTWAGLSPARVNNGGQAGMKPEKQKGRRVDLRWLLLLAELLESTSSSAGGLQQPAMLLLLPPLSSVFCYFICFFFFFFSIFSLSLFFSSLPSSLPLLSRFFFSSPVFISKNRGETWLGRPLCCCPSTTPPTRGKFLFGKWGWSTSF